MRYSKHSEGLTYDQQRYLDGPDIDEYDIVFCTVCGDDREMNVTGFRADPTVQAYCEVCDNTLTIAKQEQEPPW